MYIRGIKRTFGTPVYRTPRLNGSGAHGSGPTPRLRRRARHVRRLGSRRRLRVPQQVGIQGVYPGAGHLDTRARARVCSHTCVHPPVHPAHPESAVYTPGVLGIFAGKTPKRTVVYTLHTLRASFLLRLSNTRRRMCRVRPGVHGTHPACLRVHPICVAVSAGKQAQTRSMYTLHTLRAIL